MRYRRTAVVLVTGSLLTVLGTAVAAWDTGNDVRSRLEERADRAAAVLDLQLRRYASASRAVAALRADDPTEQEWLARLDRLGVAADLPSTYSIAAADLQADDGSRSLVIDRVAPLEPNRAALGLDLLGVAAAAPAATRAVDQEVVSMSDALTLVQEPGDQSGLAVYAPWYRDDGSLGGSTNIVLRGQDFLDALAMELGELGVRVVDPDTPEGPREVGRIVPGAGLSEGLSTLRRIEPLGQTWELEVTAPAAFLSTTERWGAWLTLFGLLAITALVGALVHLLQRREEHARRLAQERTAELIAANRDLEEAMAAKDEFLAVVTHEFRTPITVIRGFAETAAAGRSGDLPPTVRQWLDRIDQHARRLHALMDNVLTTARLQAGELTVEPEVVDVGRLAAAVADQHPHLAPLEVDVTDPLLARADPAHLVRVLDALLSNAGKYGRPPVQVVGRADGDEVVITVADSGDGVPEELAPRIFTAFEQADRGETRRSRGVGLGLSVVRRLCEQMGGSVRLCDSPSGACFEVRLGRVTVDREGGGPEVASIATATDED